MNKLSFNILRDANLRRLPLFKNKNNEAAHITNDGSDWSLSQWVNATVGEVGELAEMVLLATAIKSLGKIGNWAKKIDRKDFNLDAVRDEIANELADVQGYLDLLAYRAGIDLGQATVDKWNEVSRRIGVDLRISTDGTEIYEKELDV